MTYTIFSKLTLNNESDEKALVEIQSYQQLASQLRQRYQLINSIVPLIDDEDKAKDISFSFSNFNTNFTEANQEANKYIQ